ncbi:protein of unknown function [Methylocella tundrae]|uniref:Uncharacterized protein n=1 Tax=Methylocella tundrae TaxID=227605 RepID=A0A4U8Z4Q5_METTU|nr:protein of unknown function [Methylocella tundrae]
MQSLQGGLNALSHSFAWLRREPKSILALLAAAKRANQYSSLASFKSECSPSYNFQK